MSRLTSLQRLFREMGGVSARQAELAFYQANDKEQVVAAIQRAESDEQVIAIVQAAATCALCVALEDKSTKFARRASR